MNKGDIIRQKYRDIRNESDFIFTMKNKIENSNLVNDICGDFDIKLHSIVEILKIEDIQATASLTEEMKMKLIRYIKYYYNFYFSIDRCNNRENGKKTKRIKSSTPLRRQVIKNNELLLTKLSKGFSDNRIGLFETMRIDKIDELNKDILFLKRLEKQSKTKKTDSKSDFQKPRARIILTPMGGQVK
jgi:hypothetical protein